MSAPNHWERPWGISRRVTLKSQNAGSVSLVVALPDLAKLSDEDRAFLADVLKMFTEYEPDPVRPHGG